MGRNLALSACRRTFSPTGSMAKVAIVCSLLIGFYELNDAFRATVTETLPHSPSKGRTGYSICVHLTTSPSLSRSPRRFHYIFKPRNFIWNWSTLAVSSLTCEFQVATLKSPRDKISPPSSTISVRIVFEVKFRAVSSRVCNKKYEIVRGQSPQVGLFSLLFHFFFGKVFTVRRDTGSGRPPQTSALVDSRII